MGAVALVTKLGSYLMLVAGLFDYWLGFSNKEITINTQQLIAFSLGVEGSWFYF